MSLGYVVTTPTPSDTLETLGSELTLPRVTSLLVSLSSSQTATIPGLQSREGAKPLLPGLLDMQEIHLCGLP